MKKFILAIILVGASLHIANSYAQEQLTARLDIITPPSGMPIDAPKASMWVENIGDSSSPPFTLKLWVSIDNSFTDDDVPVTRDSGPLSACTNPDDCPRSSLLLRPYRLPLPGAVIDPSERLFDDTRTVSEWMGQRVYYQACISISGGPFERCVTGSNVVIGPSASAVSPSRGSFDDQIQVRWVQDLDELDNPLATNFQVSRTRDDSLGGTEVFDLTLADIDVDTSGLVPMYRYIDKSAATGVRYWYRVRNCNDVSGTVFCQEAGLPSSGFASGTYRASTGSELGEVRVSWHEFSKNTEGYDVYRCLHDPLPSCTKVAEALTSLEYLDTTVIPGQQYVYQIEACEFTELFDLICFEIGQSNIGFAPLVDAYEDDDIPYMGAVVDRSVTQSRTFDVVDDQDWVKIMVSRRSGLVIKTSGAVDIDTKLTLFDETATNQIAFSDDTPGDPTEHALLRLPSLASGVYFLVVEQGSSPVPNTEYQLEISFGSPGPTKDIYEPDNSAATAKLVRRSVSQTRSFHVANDVDWVRLELAKTQAIAIRTTGEIFVDTELWLYDSELNEIEYSPNTPGVVTAHATIVRDRLLKGTYYLKVSQQRKPGFPFPPIETYGLEVMLQEAAPVNMVPIIDLLLSDDRRRSEQQAKAVDRVVK